MVENLAPKEAYEVDDTGYRERLSFVTGLVFGFFVGIACLLLTPAQIGFAWRILLSVGTAVFGGIVFGWGFANRFNKRMSSVLDRLYVGDPAIDVSPPSEKELRYRLPCSWKRNAGLTVGGVLYVGPNGLLFMPHKVNLPQDRAAFEMGPNKNLTLSLTLPELSTISKLVVPHPLPQLSVAWPEGTAQFIIPSPNEVFNLIKKRLREMA